MKDPAKSMYAVHSALRSVQKQLSQLGEDLDNVVGTVLDDEHDGDSSVAYEIGEVRDDVEACYDKLQRIVAKLYDVVNAAGGPPTK